ncbi:MAG: phosphoribosylformylglycinamidine cyclo-ligase [Limnochordia bacterium]|jgi:phosphoribosylformylglycinamidine cyclo-ligase
MERKRYRDAGVDVQAGYETVRLIKEFTKATHRPEVLTEIGSFGGLFSLGEHYRDPVLVSGTDGVGTKLKIAFMMDKHDTIGIDLVAYCVNDIICHGAEPLFFLDYLAMGKVEPPKAAAIVQGIAAGCQQAGCALIGGETAEMPGFYQPGEYDLAGFAVGVVEKEEIINGEQVQAGDVIIGLASTGLQSSGYSLVRKVFFEEARLSVDTYLDELGRTLGEELLEPTGIYARVIQALQAKCKLKGIANISGGGLPENLPRSFGLGLKAVVETSSWEVPPIFQILAAYGEIPRLEMYGTFNMGIAMAIIVAPEEASRALEVLASAGQKAMIIGRMEPGQGEVELI